MNNSRLEITDTQEKILWTFLEHRDTTIVRDSISKKDRKPRVLDSFEPMIRGLSSYDLEKNKIPRRTWDINCKYLLDYQLVSLIREEKKGKQLRKYYDITPVGRFTLLQKLSIDSLKENFIGKFSIFVPEIAAHWKELEEKFGNTLYFILRKSLLQINWFQWKKDMKINEDKFSLSFGVRVIEKTVIPFELDNIELTLFREYTDFTTTKGKQSRQEIIENIKSAEIVIPTSLDQIDFDKINNNVLNRLVFVFYYNLIRLHKEDVAVARLAEWVWQQQNFENYKKELREDYLNTITRAGSKRFDLVKKIKKASKETIIIIQKDKELQNMLREGMNEINSKFSKPKIMNELLLEINL